MATNPTANVYANLDFLEAIVLFQLNVLN